MLNIQILFLKITILLKQSADCFNNRKHTAQTTNSRCICSKGHVIFIKIENIQSNSILYPSTLHPGEIEVFTLAKEMNAALCIIDDLLARNYAVHLGLKITGSVGILLLAKDLGIIKNIKPCVDKFVENNFRISQKVYRDILTKANEI